jgi:hypothetical protein
LKDIVIITAYCDTIEKQQILIDCISQFKNKDIDILLHSHYPTDIEAQNLCDYYLYDSSNPILTISEHNKCIVHWYTDSQIKRKLTSTRDDYGYAVMQQYIRSFNFIKDFGYDKLFFCNYDVFVSDDYLQRSRNALNEFDAIFNYFDEIRFFELNLIFFSGNFNFIEKFINSMEYNDYINSKNNMLEQHLMIKIDELSKNHNIQKLAFEDYGGIIGTDKSTDLDAKVSYIGPFSHMELENCNIFGGINNLNCFEFIVYNIKDKINIELVIDDIEQHIISNVSNFYIINTSVTEELKNIVKNNNLHIKINGIEIDKQIYNIFLKNNIELYN